MGMKAALARSLSAALVALGIWAALQLTDILAFCLPHRAYAAAHDGHPGVIRDRGERVARWGDAIFTCETTHTIGPVAVHQDLDCVCAPGTLSPGEVAAAVGGECRIDHEATALMDDTGSCRTGHCNRYVGE